MVNGEQEAKREPEDIADDLWALAEALIFFVYNIFALQQITKIKKCFQIKMSSCLILIFF